jgi:hypothetical protein
MGASAAFTGMPDRALCQRLNPAVTVPSHNVHMTQEYPLTLRQADQAREDFAAINSDLQFVMDQLAKLPSRAYLCRVLLLAMGATWALLAALLLLR